TKGNANRRRRRRRQTSGSLYGTNANLGASAPSGFNYPASTNIQGIRLNNPDARDLLGNPIISTNAEGALSSVNLYNQPRPQQQQVYGTNDQSLLNTMYNGNNYYSGGTRGTSSNTQMAYPPNSNQVLTNKDLYGTISNTNTNNNQYGYSSNLLPNSNTYGGAMGSSSSNLIPSSNTYTGQMGSNTNLVPNSNTYSGVMGTNSNPNSWSNTNNYNRYSQGGANPWYPNRDTGYSNNNNYNSYGYQSGYSNYYNNSYRLDTSCLLIIFTILMARTL
ncbi:unnamed protein product, partial [Adineta ricciae]